MRISDWSSDVCSSDLGYERLEFLGDRVLALVVAELLFERFPDENEGELSRRLVGMVRREALLRVAQEFGFGRSLAMAAPPAGRGDRDRTEAHTSEPHSPLRLSYSAFCLTKRIQQNNTEAQNTIIEYTH